MVWLILNLRYPAGTNLLRDQTLHPFSLTWDEWDKVTLRRSNAILKKMFKSYYYSRNFDEGQDAQTQTGANLVIKNLKELFKFAHRDQRIMPWWKRRASNPFNNKDELCERKE